MKAIEGYKLSPQQARVWAAWGDDRPRRSQCAIRIRGRLDREALQIALNAIVARHETLRTEFLQSPGMKQPIQSMLEEVRPLRIAMAPARAAGESDSRSVEAAAETNGLTARLEVIGDEDCLLHLAFPLLSVDRRSMANIAAELAAAYQHGPGEGDEEPVQYLDFSEWQFELLESEAAQAGHSFWQKQGDGVWVPSLAGEPEPGPGFDPRVHRGPSLAAIPDSGGEACLLAAWFALWHRIGGGERCTLEITLENRPFDSFAHAMGLFAATLPLSAASAPGETFAPLGRRIAALLGEAATYQAFLPERRSSPVRGIAFEYVREREEPGAFALEKAEIHHQPFKIKLLCQASAGGIQLEFHYDRDLYQPERIARLAASFQCMLTAAIAAPETPVTYLPMLDSEQRAQLVEAFNRTDRRLQAPAFLHLRIEAQAAHLPDRVAVTSEDTRLTYDELNRRANRLAQRLIGLGLQPDAPVAVCLARGLDLAVALTAVLKAGGAYLPLDPNYPADRLRYTVTDSGADLILTHSALAGIFAGQSALVVCLDDSHTQRALAACSDQNPDRLVSPQQAAYIIYTSGSTGKPKGVRIAHHSAANYLDWCVAAYGLTAGNQVPLHSSIGFDLTVTSLFAPLICGAGVDMVPEEAGLARLIERLERGPRPGLLKLTPAHLNLMADALSGLASEAMPATFVLGGEALDARDLTPWWQMAPQSAFINEYGPTEATVGCCYHRAGRDDRGDIRIGKPIANMRIYLLDEKLQPLPRDVPGQIYIGGVGLARDYLGRPGLTAERFIPDPFAAQAGERLYKTGDRARFDGGDEAALVFLGRADKQVKIRGFRIELGEIEAVLQSHPGVDRALVQARSDAASGAKRLAAYYLGERVIASDRLHAYLGEFLPEYMLPAHFVHLTHLPLTLNGKVDVDALPEPAHVRPQLTQAFTPPSPGLETELAAIFQKALALDMVGAEDDFFALGGDSIRAIRVTALAKDLGHQFTVQQFYECPSIAQLAEFIEEMRGQTPEPENAALTYRKTEAFELIGAADRAALPATVEDAYPLSATQLGMLFHMEIEKDSPSPPAYHNVNTFRVNLPFEPAAFQRAVDRVVARHPIMRTFFDLNRYSEPLQLVLAATHARLRVHLVDLRRFAAEHRDRMVEEFIREENFRLLDITRAPLVRLHIHWLDEDLISVTLTEPHSISDGWSTNLTLIEIFENHLALMRGEQPPRQEPIPVSYRDFIHMERAVTDSPRAQAFWSNKLRELAGNRLPGLTEADSDEAGIKDHKHYFSIPADVIGGLERTCQRAGVPFKTCLLAAHLKVVSMITGQSRVTTGLVFNGRPEVDGGDRVRGLFLNTLPFPFTLRAETWLELLARLWRAEREMVPYRRYPSALLQAARSGNPLFEVAFSFHHFHSGSDLASRGDMKGVASSDLSRTNFGLMASFNMNPAQHHRLTLILEGVLARIGKSRFATIADYYQTVMADLAQSPDRAIQRRSYLRPDEAALYEALNRTVTDAEIDLPVHRLFERQASATPEAIAVMGPDPRGQCGQLSYAELDARARDLGSRLSRLGAGPDQLVAICLPRSMEMLVAILAVHKAGSAYLPLDPNYPDSRLRFMVADAKAKLTIATCGQADNFADWPTRVLYIDREESPAGEAEELDSAGTNALPAPDSRHLSHVIYTSGSTGQPKGAAIPHRAVTALIRWASDRYAREELAGVLAATSICFDLSVFEIYAPLSCGGTVILARDALQLNELENRDRVTLINTVPSALAELLAQGALPDSLMTVNLAGEPLPLSLAQRLFEIRSDVRLYNLYGPSEDTTYSTWARVEPASMQNPPIGRPVWNTHAHVLDSMFSVAPAGLPGELYLGGAGLARGYLDRPDLTAQRFVPDPFSGQAGQRLYRSGDMVRLNRDGQLQFLGRLDNQVKIRGFRIEPGEIEGTLRRHPKVSAAVVRAWREKDVYLCAYVVAEPGLNAVDLRHFLKGELPEHMVPARFAFLDHLPLTANGKLDRAALPKPSESGLDGESRFVAPVTAIETRVAGVWAKLLNLDRLGRNHHFFELGGHSLTATRAISLLREEYAVNLTIRNLFDHPTVGEFAHFIEVAQWSGGQTPSSGDEAAYEEEEVL